MKRTNHRLVPIVSEKIYLVNRDSIKTPSSTGRSKRKSINVDKRSTKVDMQEDLVNGEDIGQERY